MSIYLQLFYFVPLSPHGSERAFRASCMHCSLSEDQVDEAVKSVLKEELHFLYFNS